ncbi:hypothetical protein L202_00399 [Cryptococcus amylolentus CBS 6039]|uniref:Uncharacterized protein n=1 Tax=Cryptococcus amylolentus CBS 6039 TaxID=1295533 RepID=A0A1E3I729_9TREE|nr:hypothetical protein L202_00399 [Cryptococcus amylolentus CBS 6039]ODN84449.1 hypothetical protein L202_00399 [Cryptococcus amylolentus CBS 6039]
MPRRVSYQQHRATLDSFRDPSRNRFRHGSVAESETDLESIFSSTTYQSHGSSPYPRQLSLHPPFEATSRSNFDNLARESSPFSSGRAYSSSPGPTYRNPRRASNLGPRPTVESDSNPGVSALGLEITPEDVPTESHLPVAAEQSNHKRDRRRAVAAERSTLTGGNFESPLRLWIRWMTWRGWAGWTLCVGQVGAVVINLISGQLSGRFAQFKPGDWVMEALRALGWCAAVWSWATDEGQRGGRSLRSQITSILTIILSPLILSGDHLLALSSTVASLRLLSSGHDLSAAAITLSTCILSVKTWQYALSVWGYLVGKSIWMGSRQQMRLSINTLLVVSPLLAACTCYVRKRISYSIDILLGGLLNVSEPLSSEFLIPLLEVLPLKECIAYSDGQYTWHTVLRTIQAYISQHKLLLTGNLIGALAPLAVLLYSSYSFQPPRQSSAHKSSPRRPPMYNLVLQTMSIISSSSSVFLGSRRDVVLPVFPLLLMMSLRGGSARGSEGLGVGDDVWLAGSWAVCVGAVTAAEDLRSLLVSLAAAVLWSTLIGAPRHLLLATSLAGFVRYGSMMVPSIALASNVVFTLAGVAGWAWGMEKMIESAWALGGLSGRRSTTKGKDTRPK